MFLIGSIAIIGVPPLNGFVSEWLVYQGLLGAGAKDGIFRIAVLAAPVLALVGGLALACFAKVAGVIFLGRARTERAVVLGDVGRAYLIPQVTLAAGCVLIGLLPAVAVVPAIHIGAMIVGNASSESAAAALVMPGVGTVALYAGALAAILGAFTAGRARLMRRRTVRFGPTWSCGFDAPPASMQYTASSFAAPLTSLFGHTVGVEEHRGATVFHSEPRDLILDRGVLRAGGPFMVRRCACAPCSMVAFTSIYSTSLPACSRVSPIWSSHRENRVNTTASALSALGIVIVLAPGVTGVGNADQGCADTSARDAGLPVVPRSLQAVASRCRLQRQHDLGVSLRTRRRPCNGACGSPPRAARWTLIAVALRWRSGSTRVHIRARSLLPRAGGSRYRIEFRRDGREP